MALGEKIKCNRSLVGKSKKNREALPLQKAGARFFRQDLPHDLPDQKAGQKSVDENVSLQQLRFGVNLTRPKVRLAPTATECAIAQKILQKAVAHIEVCSEIGIAHAVPHLRA